MSVTVTFDPSVDGSWEEAQRVLTLLKPHDQTALPPVPLAITDSETLDAEIISHVLKKDRRWTAPKALPPLVLDWLRYQVQMGRTLRIGASKKAPDGLGNYIQVYPGEGGRYGAFAVINLGGARIDYRLPPQAAEGYPGGHDKPAATSAYKVQAYLSKASYQDCIGLSNDAYGYSQQAADWA